MLSIKQILLFSHCLILLTTCNVSSQISSGDIEPINKEFKMDNNNDQEKQTFTNSLGMEFIKIPAGSFLMGSEEDDLKAYDIEKPQHEVTISKDFYLGKYEVTQKEWEDL